MKKLSAAFLLCFVSLSVTAAQKPLLSCALMGNTPTELGNELRLPWETIDFYRVSKQSFQLHHDNIYQGREQHFRIVRVEDKSGDSAALNGVPLGQYRTEGEQAPRQVSLSLERGRIQLKVAGTDYTCEVPGRYQKTYRQDR